MSANRIITVRLFIFSLSVVAILTSCGGNNMLPDKESGDFSQLIDSGKIFGLNLTIYYMSPFIDTRLPVSIDDLIYGRNAENDPPKKNSDTNGLYEQKIIVDGGCLIEHIDLLSQIAHVDLIPAESESYLDTRIYFRFETEEEGKLFDVAMWSGSGNIFVNGIEVKANDVFYDMILPFLPQDAAKNLEAYLNLDVFRVY